MHLLVIRDYVCALYFRRTVHYCVFLSSEASLSQYLSCRRISESVLLEGILVMCVSLGGTPFVFLVITVLCIATSCVLRKRHSLIHLKIFVVCDACCI